MDPTLRRNPVSLLVSEVFPPKTGGSGRWFWEIYRRLPREDCLIAAGEDLRQVEFDRTHDLRLSRLPLAMGSWGLRSFEGLRGYWRNTRRLLKIVRSAPVGMLHCGRCLPEGLMALALKMWTGVPYLCYVHGEEVSYASGSRELSWLVRRTLRGAELVIANSNNTKRMLVRDWSLPDKRVCVLHPGVDTRRFVPASRDSAVRAELGWFDRPTVLTVGRLQKRKGHDQMIRALARIRQIVPHILYAVIGDGEERGALEELVRRHRLESHVLFHGQQADDKLVRSYQQCDLFVLPNRQVDRDFEGFGMVLVEAQSCGKPVVAGASGGTTETMRIPETGFVVPCEEPDQLAALVEKLLPDRPRLETMGSAARRWVVEQFDWNTLSGRAQQVFALAHRARADLPAA